MLTHDQKHNEDNNDKDDQSKIIKSLIDAIKEGNTDEAIYLLMNEEIDLEQSLQNGKTILKLACEFGLLELVKYLVYNNVSIWQADKQNETPLFIAVNNGHNNLIDYLLACGANTQIISNTDNSMVNLKLHQNNRSDLVMKMLEGKKLLAEHKSSKALKVFKGIEKQYQELYNSQPSLDLAECYKFSACCHNNLYNIKLALDYFEKSYLTIKDLLGDKNLLTFKAMENYETYEGKNSYFSEFTSESDFKEMFNWYYKSSFKEKNWYDININRTSDDPYEEANYSYPAGICLTLPRDTPFTVAIKTQNETVVQKFLNSNIDPNIQNQDEIETEYVAHEKLHITSVYEIKKYDYPIHIAAQHGTPQIMNSLLNAGTVRESLGYHGQTALHDIAKQTDWSPFAKGVLQNKLPEGFNLKKYIISTIDSVYGSDRLLNNKQTDQDRLHIMKLLLESNLPTGFNLANYIQIQDEFGNTALHYACGWTLIPPKKTNINENLINCILAHSDSSIISIKNKHGYDCVDVLRKLIKTLSDARDQKQVEAILKKILHIAESTNNKNNEFFKAIENLDFEKIKTLVSQSPELIHSRNIYTNNALYEAIYALDNLKQKNKPYKDHVNIIKFLVEQGCDINHHGYRGRTPLYMALTLTDEALFDYLISKGANIHKENDYDADLIVVAASLSTWEPTLLLLKRNILPIGNCKMAADGIHRNYVHNAALENRAENINMLAKWLDENDIGAKMFEHKLDQYHYTIKAFEFGDNFDRTPLHCATLEGKLDALKCLLNLGFDLNKKDKYGRTPFQIAAENDQVEVVKYLVEFDPKLINAIDKFKRSILHLCAESNAIKTAEYLLSIQTQLQIDINARDNKNRTPLHLAARDGHLGIMCLLLKASANHNILDIQGCTPLLIAICHNKKYKSNDELEKAKALLSNPSPELISKTLAYVYMEQGKSISYKARYEKDKAKKETLYQQKNVLFAKAKNLYEQTLSISANDSEAIRNLDWLTQQLNRTSTNQTYGRSKFFPRSRGGNHSYHQNRGDTSSINRERGANNSTTFLTNTNSNNRYNTPGRNNNIRNDGFTSRGRNNNNTERSWRKNNSSSRGRKP